MDKNEMKNKYSAFITETSEILGLGKPVDILKLCATTDLFFQPLEKRIAELEEQLAISEHDREHNDYELIEVYTKVKNIEKENTELKKKYAKECEDVAYVVTNYSKQLTKVKEIIKNLMVYVPVDLKEYEEAKQFINEVEK